ncbi:hypothetical protein J416_15462 [Gracilibacillus halophilus YIM-C55.5]|uniref:Permease n=1 Tax=Gracilibacillus halophilus YIM-C55.5 TaxID=1308866 RepID=N4WQU5_9BACI|nr:hypothetical protein [Gracilibacillus halophilus]ENH95561.1 hypothetical protein J416_15462 [Gracilibacillus halophilus YIM-C55.5]
MKQIYSTGLKLSIIVYTILHFISYFYENKRIIVALAISGCLLLLFAILTRSLRQLKMPIGLVIAGLLIMFVTDTSMVQGLYNGFLEMRNMIGLLFIVPTISWVLHEEEYIESIMGVFHHLLDTSRKFYFGLVFFTQIIAYFLLFGAITMMYQFASSILKNEKGEAWENYKGTALIRGFSLSVMWVISIPSFAYVIEVMNAPLGLSIIQGFLIAFIGILIGLCFSFFEEKHYHVNLSNGLQTEINDVLSHHTDYKKMRRHVMEFLILFITLFGTIFLLQGIVSIELLVLIPLVVMVWIVLYFVIKGRLLTLFRKATFFYQEGMVHQSYQLCVMLGAGVLIYSLNQTAFATLVVDGIYQLQSAIPFLNLLYFLPFIIILLGFVGLGPLTVMVLVGGILQSIDLTYPPELVVLAITSGSTISIVLSPLIMPIIALSSVNGLSPVKNGVVFNWKFAFAIYVIVQIYIQGRLALL